jgi:DNA repair exonuclease SbcCD ATPase subunit
MTNGIISVHIENFKKLENIEAELNGQSIFLIGDNEVGKSSFMQAVFALLSNEILPTKSITEGKTDGKIEIKFMVDGHTYTAVKKFTEKNPKGYFEIQTDNGLKTDRVSYLETIVGNISFNPFEFVEQCNTAEGRRRQVEFLRKLIPADVNLKIDQLDTAYKMAYQNRAKVNATITQLDGEIAGINVPDAEQYKEPIDVSALMDEITKANAVNGKRDQLSKDIVRGQDSVSKADAEIERLKKALKAAETERKRVATKLADIQSEFENTKPVLTAELESKIKNASQHNANVETVKRYNELKAKHTIATEESLSLSNRLLESVTDKSKLIRESGLPIDGLSFDENGLYMNKLPLNEDQVATSVIMDLGVRIAVALNPKLKIIRIPRGESMGKKRLDDVIDFAKKNGYQLFIERVESGVDKLTIQFIES